MRSPGHDVVRVHNYNLLHQDNCHCYPVMGCACQHVLGYLQVVVDTEQTAKALLSKGQLRNRVTIIPLNKVGWKAGHCTVGMVGCSASG